MKSLNLPTALLTALFATQARANITIGAVLSGSSVRSR